MVEIACRAHSTGDTGQIRCVKKPLPLYEEQGMFGSLPFAPLGKGAGTTAHIRKLFVQDQVQV